METTAFMWIAWMCDEHGMAGYTDLVGDIPLKQKNHGTEPLQCVRQTTTLPRG